MSPSSFTPQPILDVARELSIPDESVIVCGRGKAKIELSAVARPPVGAGRLILVSAINPTPAGEGKTTTSVGLAMGMRRLGKRVVLALRQPSLGPVFGVKGGATGGGRAMLVPTDDINLHFTGDIHAITTAHNLLSAMADNACHFGLPLAGHDGGRPPMPPGPAGDGEARALDARSITWGRALDMNDRALRNVVLGLGRRADGVPRQDRFDITAASEVMAIVALATSHADLEERLARVLVGSSASGAPITAGDVGAAGAMTALLRDALLPNLVQTAEGGPALVHAGPFGNIAHGCSSVLGTRLGLACGDYTITEAGFGFDLGGEKFLDIKCRAAGIWPRALVLVVTLRALKMHGGVRVSAVSEPDPAAVERGLAHLEKHLDTAAFFGLPVVVAINVFPTDTAAELALVDEAARRRGVRSARCEGFARGGEGAVDLARAVVETADATDPAPPEPRYVYDLAEPIRDKAQKIAQTVYGAAGVAFTGSAAKDLQRIEALGYANLPVCMAKTQLSLTDDPTVPGRPSGFTITVREVRLSAGAGFVVPLTGEMVTMPGLPREPAALRMKLLDNGRIRGLMQHDD